MGARDVACRYGPDRSSTCPLCRGSGIDEALSGLSGEDEPCPTCTAEGKIAQPCDRAGAAAADTRSMKTTEQTVADYAASIAADFPHLCAAQVGGMVTDALAADDECQDVDWRELDRLAYAAAVAAGAAR